MTVNSISTDDLANRFTYKPAKNDQPERYGAIRDDALKLATTINEEAPDGREKSLAITKIEEAVTWASAAIARSE